MVGWALLPCNLREKLNSYCSLGYLVVGWALRPCNRSYNLNSNCRVGYLLVGWAFRPCNRWESEIGIVGWDIVWWDGLYARVI